MRYLGLVELCSGQRPGVGARCPDRSEMGLARPFRSDQAQPGRRPVRPALDQAIGNLHQAEANLDKSQFDVTRFTPLAREGGISQQQFDYTLMVNRANQASVAVARAAVETAKLNLSRTKLTSPLTGIAGSSVAQLGDLVTPTLVLTTISQVDPIKVSCPMSEQLYLRLARKLKEQPQGHAILLSSSAHRSYTGLRGARFRSRR